MNLAYQQCHSTCDVNKPKKFKTMNSNRPAASKVPAVLVKKTHGRRPARVAAINHSRVRYSETEVQNVEVNSAQKSEKLGESLPAELWNEIISIADPHPGSLASLCRVSKLFAAVNTPILYRDAFQIVISSRSNKKGAQFIRTVEDNLKLASFIRIYRELPRHLTLSPTVLGAITNIGSAFLTFRVFDFVQYCPSREIETISIDFSPGPPKQCVVDGDLEMRLIQWLTDQSYVWDLDIRRENGWLDEFPLPSGALPRLKSLTCDAKLAVVILPVRPVKRYSIRPPLPTSSGRPTSQEILMARQLLETSTPPSLIAALPNSVKELKLGMRSDEIVAKLQLLSEHAPTISYLLIEVPAPPHYDMCQAIAPILATFTVLDSFILNFTEVGWGDVMSYSIGCTPRLLNNWIQACPSLRTVRINDGVDDTWIQDAFRSFRVAKPVRLGYGPTP
ncbi:hypothetical protein FRB95_008921 [Tulasnella sp. JGI-2019a]|nr:hypothetical protein FRB93_007720 [Tulasnella sp. JGI-2019a]KAG9026357.1 hypothetical protein FRB95_008921 [Tulasnella sp. JGI-2019a]